MAGAREALARYVVARARVGTGAELYLQIGASIDTARPHDSLRARRCVTSAPHLEPTAGIFRFRAFPNSMLGTLGPSHSRKQSQKNG